MKFNEMVFTIQIDHAIIYSLLNSIARSNDRDARKRLVILKHLLINHFLVEEFVLYPFIRKQLIRNETSFCAILSNAVGDFDVVGLMKEMENYNSIGSRVIAILSECMLADGIEFKKLFSDADDLIRGRMVFEETKLFLCIDTSRVKLLRKRDFSRLHTEE